MKSKEFNAIYEEIMKDISVDEYADELVSDFLFDDRFNEAREKFEARLNEELAKVKPKNELLENVELDFSGSEIEDEDDMITMMAVEHIEPYDKILVNLIPFVTDLNERVNDNEAFEDAIVDYIYDPKTGEHVVQHECAHIIDLKKNAGRTGWGSHDETFANIRKHLDDIEPHLDES